MKSKIIILIVTILVCAVFAISQNPHSNKTSPCLDYEPSRVELVGTIKRQTFPGRPNYESIAKCDEPEPYWILHVAKPFCVNASEDWLEKEIRVSRVQLVFIGSGNEYRRYRQLVGRKVVVAGSLFHQITGHHHTKILLTVNSIKARK